MKNVENSTTEKSVNKILNKKKIKKNQQQQQNQSFDLNCCKSNQSTNNSSNSKNDSQNLCMKAVNGETVDKISKKIKDNLHITENGHTEMISSQNNSIESEQQLKVNVKKSNTSVSSSSSSSSTKQQNVKIVQQFEKSENQKKDIVSIDNHETNNRLTTTMTKKQNKKSKNKNKQTNNKNLIHETIVTEKTVSLTETTAEESPALTNLDMNHVEQKQLQTSISDPVVKIICRDQEENQTLDDVKFDLKNDDFVPEVVSTTTTNTVSDIINNDQSCDSKQENVTNDCSSKNINNDTISDGINCSSNLRDTYENKNSTCKTVENCNEDHEKTSKICFTQEIETTKDQSDIVIEYKEYESELQMQDIMRLIQTELSEPYSIYTYRYFIYNWPKLCFLAAHGNEYVGAIVCKLDMHMNVKRGYIAMLAVKKEYRKLRIGTTLVQKAIEAMLADNADEVVLETEMKNIPALRLYENLGFVRDKRLFRYYLNGVDALRLKLWFR